jgi:hypothetical protein
VERGRLAELRQRQVVELERVSGLTAAEARQTLLRQIVDEAQAEAQQRVRDIERHAQRRATSGSQDPDDRHAADRRGPHREHTVTVVILPTTR